MLFHSLFETPSGVLKKYLNTECAINPYGVGGTGLPPVFLNQRGAEVA
jgi:hypothetical protein